jgi:hypothetical protein
VIGDACAHDQRLAAPQGACDPFAAGRLPQPDVAVSVCEHEHIAGEVRRMRAAEVELHAVAPGHRVNGEGLDAGEAHRAA